MLLLLLLVVMVVVMVVLARRRVWPGSSCGHLMLATMERAWCARRGRR